MYSADMARSKIRMYLNEEGQGYNQNCRPRVNEEQRSGRRQSHIANYLQFPLTTSFLPVKLRFRVLKRPIKP